MTQAVRGPSPGSGWKVRGSGTTTKSPAPATASDPMPASPRKSTATACPVSKRNGPGLKSIPLRSTARNAAVVRVLERASPCGSQKATRTRSIPSRPASIRSAAATCSPSQQPNCATNAGRPTLPSAGGRFQGLEYMAHSILSGVRAGGRGNAPSSASAWRATDSTSSSAPTGPTSWTPTGRPAPVRPTGSDRAGWPVRLNG